MKSKEVILVGSGGHGLSLAEFSADRIMGYLSKSANPEMPGEWLGTDEEAGRLIAEGRRFHVAYVYHGLPLMRRRRELLDYYESLGAHFETLIAPTAIVTPASRIGEGSAIMTGAIINRAEIGKNVIVNSGAIVEHDCKVGDNSFIGPGAVIGGFTTIGKNCFIGLGAKISNNITIGDNVTVAMGMIINRDLTESGIYHGNPLKRFKIKT